MIESKRTYSLKCEGRAGICLVTSVLLIVFACVGCGYSRWSYRTSPATVHGATYYFQFYVFSIDSIVPKRDSAGNPIQRAAADTTYMYHVAFVQESVASGHRLTMEVRDVYASFADSLKPLQLEKVRHSLYEDDAKAGAAVYTEVFGPLRIPVPRPDTITIDQYIVVLDSMTGERIDEFRQTVKCSLGEKRDSLFKEFLRGR